MDEQITGFRSAIVGGFRREDVMGYIEQTDKKYYTEIEELRRQLTDAQAALTELRSQNQTLTEKNAELLERLGQMTLDADKVRRQMEEIGRSLALQTTEMEAQSSRAESLAAENDRLVEQNKKLLQKCGEYDMSKEKIAEIELSAYRRARKIEEDARSQLLKLRQQSTEMIDTVKRQLDTAKENYKQVLERSQAESAEMARKAADVLGEIDRITGSFGKEPQQAIIDKINSLRARTEDKG